MDRQLTRLSKRLSFVLRHHPDKINIHLDKYGRVNLNELIQKFNQHYGNHINLKTIKLIMKQSNKKRYAIEDNNIRALYGHSIPVKPLNPPEEPPKILYHGTTHAAMHSILNEGLKKMNRDFVHLSSDTPSAMQVGRRRDNHPVLFQVNAKKASQDGWNYYHTKSGIWLVDTVPAKYLKIIKQ